MDSVFQSGKGAASENRIRNDVESLISRNRRQLTLKGRKKIIVQFYGGLVAEEALVFAAAAARNLRLKLVLEELLVLWTSVQHSAQRNADLQIGAISDLGL